jgi:hypothetical protein
MPYTLGIAEEQQRYSAVILDYYGAFNTHSFEAPMISMSCGVRIQITTGRADIRHGIKGLALLIQED